MPHILVVDDDPDLVLLLKTHLEARGHSVDGAGSVAEAMTLAAARRPHAVVLDFCLPKIDGARFIEILRADPLTQETPVIVVSAASQSWVDSRLPPDPLVRLVEKPIDFAKLDKVIAELVAATAQPKP
jgi:CheY-like chemotaxis protein